MRDPFHSQKTARLQGPGIGYSYPAFVRIPRICATWLCCNRPLCLLRIVIAPFSCWTAFVVSVSYLRNFSASLARCTSVAFSSFSCEARSGITTFRNYRRR